MRYYTWRYSATGYNRRLYTPTKKSNYRGPWRIERGPLKIPLPTAIDFQPAWTKRTSVVGPAGMSNSQYA